MQFTSYAVPGIDNWMPNQTPFYVLVYPRDGEDRVLDLLLSKTFKKSDELTAGGLVEPRTLAAYTYLIYLLVNQNDGSRSNASY